MGLQCSEHLSFPPVFLGGSVDYLSHTTHCSNGSEQSSLFSMQFALGIKSTDGILPNNSSTVSSALCVSPLDCLLSEKEDMELPCYCQWEPVD